MKNKGYLFGFISSIFFGVAAVIISTQRNDVSDSAFLMGRGIVSIAYGFAIASLSRKKFSNLKRPPSSVLARSLLASITIALNYLVIQKIGAGLGRATSAFNPIFSVIILHLFSSERLNIKEFSGITLAAIGIAFPLFFQTWENTSFMFLGVFAALVASISSQTLKVALKTQRDFVLVFYLGLFHILLSSIHSIFEKSETFLTPANLFYIAFVAIISVIGQVFMTKSFRLLSAPAATSLVLLSIPTGAILEFCIAKRSMSPSELVTAMLLICGNLLASYDSLRQPNRKT